MSNERSQPSEGERRPRSIEDVICEIEQLIAEQPPKEKDSEGGADEIMEDSARPPLAVPTSSVSRDTGDTSGPRVTDTRFGARGGLRVHPVYFSDTEGYPIVIYHTPGEARVEQERDIAQLIANREGITREEAESMRRTEINLADLEAGSILFIGDSQVTRNFHKFVLINPHTGECSHFHFSDANPTQVYLRSRDENGHLSTRIREGNEMYFFHSPQMNAVAAGTSTLEELQRHTFHVGIVELFVKPPS